MAAELQDIFTLAYTSLCGDCNKMILDATNKKCTLTCPGIFCVEWAGDYYCTEETVPFKVSCDKYEPTSKA